MALGPEVTPGKEHLAEGADIERIATDVWVLFTRRSESGIIYTCTHIDKNRWGAGGKFGLIKYNPDLLCFEDYKEEEMGKVKQQCSECFKGIPIEDLQGEIMFKKEGQPMPLPPKDFWNNSVDVDPFA
jgi:hypothetical protein